MGDDREVRRRQGNLTQIKHVWSDMAAPPLSPCSARERAAHYRVLAALISDRATHLLLLDMADELDAAARLAEPALEPAPAPSPLPRGLS